MIAEESNQQLDSFVRTINRGNAFNQRRKLITKFLMTNCTVVHFHDQCYISLEFTRIKSWAAGS